MIEVSVKVPVEIKELVSASEETLYVEALHEVAFRKLGDLCRQLEEMERRKRFFEEKYNQSFVDFSRHVPDSVEGHDDWIEWMYWTKTAEELTKKIQKLSLLKG